MAINRVKLVTNGTEKSNKVKVAIQESLEHYNMVEAEDYIDLVIAIGGDGTFLKAMRDTGFSGIIFYAGVHTGHLGFLQDISIDTVESFLYQLSTNKQIKHRDVAIEIVEIKLDSGVSNLFALNEVVVKEKDNKTLHLGVYINNKKLELFSGSEIMVSTATGSTAYNMSGGGSIVCPSLDILQITPIAPLNSKAYRSLSNSVIVPASQVITLRPEEQHKDSLLVIVDGQSNHLIGVKEIAVTIKSTGVKVIELDDYDFWERINDKFL